MDLEVLTNWATFGVGILGTVLVVIIYVAIGTFECVCVCVVSRCRFFGARDCGSLCFSEFVCPCQVTP